MRMIRLLLVLVFVASVTAGRALAQERVQLSLQSAIERAQQRSPASVIAASAYESAQWNFRAFKATYLPSLNFSGRGPGLDRNIVEIQRDDGTLTFVPQSLTSSSGNLSIEQPIPLTGGTLSLQSGLSRIDQFGENRFYQWRSSPLIVELSQPLFQFNNMRWQRRLAPLQFDASRRQYQEELAQIATEIGDRYFAAYIAQMDVENSSYNVAFNDTTYLISQGRYDLGKIAENELLESELQLLNAQTSLSDARIRLERAMQELKVQLGLPYETEIEIVPPADVPDFEVDPAIAVELARDNRAAYLNQEVQRMLSERNVAQARHRSGLGATLTARYGLNQTADLFSDAYVSPLDQQSLQVSFRMPIFEWGRRRAEFESAVAARDETEETLRLQRAQLEQEVYFLALQVRQLQLQVALSAKADTIAARRFEVARNRHTIGKIDIRDLFIAQQSKDNARQAYYRTLHAFWQAYFSLRRLTLYDFEENRPIDWTGR